MGLRAMRRGEDGTESRSTLQAAPSPDQSILFTTAGGAVGSIQFVEEQLGAVMLKVCTEFAADMSPLVPPTHRQVWPRRNATRDGMGEGLGRGAAVDGEVLGQLVQACSGTPEQRTGRARAQAAADALKKTGVGLSRVREFMAAVSGATWKPDRTTAAAP